MKQAVEDHNKQCNKDSVMQVRFFASTEVEAEKRWQLNMEKR